jgi:hypothetical protein
LRRAFDLDNPRLHDAEGVNPDTRRAKCEACGKAVYGHSARK